MVVGILPNLDNGILVPIDANTAAVCLEFATILTVPFGIRTSFLFLALLLRLGTIHRNVIRIGR